MPGVILFSESKSRLEAIKHADADIFKNRQLYLSVRRLLDTHAYKLSVRREILSMFSVEAKLKSPKQ